MKKKIAIWLAQLSARIQHKACVVLRDGSIVISDNFGITINSVGVGGSGRKGASQG